MDRERNVLLLTCASTWKHKADKKMTYSKVFWWYEWDATHAYHWEDCRGQRGQLGGVQSGWVEVTHKVLLPSWLHFLNYEHRKLKKNKTYQLGFPMLRLLLHPSHWGVRMLTRPNSSAAELQVRRT